MESGFALGVIVAISLLGFFALCAFFYLVVWGLAQVNLFWTVVPEGRAKAIELNGKFSRFIMSYKNHEFNGTFTYPDKIMIKKPGTTRARNCTPSPSPINQWEVIQKTHQSGAVVKEGFKSRYFGTLHWVGIWPIARVSSYDFTWTSLEQQPATRADDVTFALKTSQERIDYILVQEDVYAVVVKTIETKELLPVNAILFIPATVVNPYKARYTKQHWLEQIESLISDAVRSFFGRTEFADLIQRAKGDADGEDGEDPDHGRMTNDELGNILAEILIEFGVKIPYVGIRQVDPGSKAAEDFVIASGSVFVAEQKAKANKIEGRGLKERAESYYGAVSGIEGGPEMFQAEALKNSNVTVYAPSFGGGQSGFMVTHNISDKKPSKKATEPDKEDPTNESDNQTSPKKTEN